MNRLIQRLREEYRGQAQRGGEEDAAERAALAFEAAAEIESLELNWSNCSRTCAKIQTERDEARSKLDEAERKLKNYEPVSLYNGKSIEQYAADLKAAESRLDRVLHILRNAERIGSDTDIPEGSRFIQLSDTLVSQMIEDTIPNGPMASGSVRVVERPDDNG